MLSVAAGAAEKEEQKKAYDGFSGGMMLHAGYQHGKAQNLHGYTLGIGGAARVHLFRHWRVGGEGYVSTMPLTHEGDGSSIHVGWGGILSDYYINYGKMTYFAGGTIGGGSQKCLHVADGYDSEEFIPAEFAQKGFVALCPFAGVEFAISSHMHLTFRMDYLLGIHRQMLISPSGPRLFIGFMFAR